jgi:hypothetical protein
MTDVKDDTIAPKTNTVEPVAYTDIKTWVAKTGTNPAELQFPTDRWGFTSNIKKEVLKAASTIRGQQDKTDLVIAVLAVLLQHIKLRQPVDAAIAATSLQRQQAAINERAPRERVTAAVIDAAK